MCCLKPSWSYEWWTLCKLLQASSRRFGTSVTIKLTRLRTPVKTSTAYLLFCDSVHADIWDISHGMVVVQWADVCLIYLRREMLGGWGGVLMLVLWCGGGWCGLGGKQWAVEVIWTCPIISRTPSDPIFPKVLSHYFLYPFWSHISRSALLNTYALMVLCWGCCSPLKKCPWPVRQAVLGSLLDAVGCTTHRAFPYLGIRWRSAPLGISANSSVAGDFLECL